MVDIVFACPNCGTALVASGESGGQAGTCPKCKGALVAPATGREKWCVRCGKQYLVGDGLGREASGCPACGQTPVYHLAPPLATGSTGLRLKDGGPRTAYPREASAAPVGSTTAPRRNAPADSMLTILRAPFSSDLGLEAMLVVLGVFGRLLLGCVVAALGVVVASKFGTSKDTSGHALVVLACMAPFVVWTTGYMAQRYMAVADQYSCGGLLARSETHWLRSLLLLLGVLFWGVLPLALSMFFWPLAMVTGPWLVVYLPMGLVLAGAQGQVNPIRTLIVVLRDLPRYTLLLVYLAPFYVVTLLVTETAIVLIRQFLPATFGGVMAIAVPMVVVQYANLAAIAMTAMLLRGHDQQRRMSRRDELLAGAAIAGATMIMLVTIGFRLLPFWAIHPLTDAQRASRARFLVTRVVAHRHRKPRFMEENRAPVPSPLPWAVGEMTKLMPHLDRFFAVYGHTLQPANDRDSLRQQALADIVRELPATADLAPLIHTPVDCAILYPVALDKVTASRDIPWLMEQSCAPEPEAKQFCAVAIQQLFPFADMTDAEAAQLVAPLELAAKQAICERLYDQINQRNQARLVGYHKLRINAVWKESGTAHPVTFTTLLSVLRVVSKNREWGFDLRGVRWRGAPEAFDEVELTCDVPVAEMLGDQNADLNKYRVGAENVRVTLTCHRGRLDVQVHCDHLVYAAPHKKLEWVYGKRGINRHKVEVDVPERPGFTEFSGALIKGD